MTRANRLRCLPLLLFLAVAVTGGAADDLRRDILAELPHFVDEVRVRWEVPGVAVGVVADGEVLFSGGLGTLDLGGGERVTGRSLFAIGSATKSVTAMAVQVLADGGALDLDEPVRSYLPEFELQDPYATLNVTVRDLLAHRTGLPRHDSMWYRSDASRDELMSMLRYLAPSAHLRERFHYSNLMYMAAGSIVGRLSGGTWEEFVRDRLLLPLGMNRSFTGLPPADDPDVAVPHAADRDDELRPLPFYDFRAVAPAGSIYSCVDDMTRWLQLLLGRGRFGDRSIVSSGRVEELWTPQIVVPGLGPRDTPITTYGLGWFVQTYRGRLYAWHTGMVDGYYGLVSLLPNDGIGVVVLTNRSKHQLPEVVSRWLFDRFLGLPEIDWNTRLEQQERAVREARERAIEDREVAREPDASPALGLEGYAGRYRHPAYGEILVEIEDSGLRATFHGMAGPLEHFAKEIFLFHPADNELRDEYVVRFQIGGDGRTMSMSAAMEDDVPPIVFMRMSAPGGQEPEQ